MDPVIVLEKIWSS